MGQTPNSNKLGHQNLSIKKKKTNSQFHFLFNVVATFMLNINSPFQT